MILEKHKIIKHELQNYFSKTLKNRFKKYYEDSGSLEITIDYDTHCLIESLVSCDGFEVFGMSATMDCFQVYLDFSQEYLAIEKFPFSRLTISFVNDGNYHVTLNDSFFEKDLQVFIQDDFNNLTLISEHDLQLISNQIQQTHMFMLLKN